MKKGWEYKTLKEACIQLFAGGDVPKPYISKTKTKEFSVPIYSNGVENEGLYGYTNSAKIKEQAVTISARGTIGATFRRYEPFFPAIRLITAVPNKEILSIDYLFYALKILTIGNSGTSIPQLTIPNIKNISIPIPPLSEQKEIVEYLDSSFAKIDKLKENAAKNLEEAKALFQSALKNALEPKEGWEEKTLGELGSLKNGMNFTKNESGTELHILGVGDFGNLFSISNTENLPIISLNEIPSDDYMLENEDIVFVRSNGNKNLVGRCLLVYPGNIKTSFSGFCIRFRKNSDKVDAKYLAYFLKAPNTRKKIAGNGANISNLNQKVLQSLAIPFPSLPEQQSIVFLLDSLSEKVNTLQQNYSRICDECDALKQAILRQVFE